MTWLLCLFWYWMWCRRLNVAWMSRCRCTRRMTWLLCHWDDYWRVMTNWGLIKHRRRRHKNPLYWDLSMSIDSSFSNLDKISAMFICGCGCGWAADISSSIAVCVDICVYGIAKFSLFSDSFTSIVINTNKLISYVEF